MGAIATNEKGKLCFTAETQNTYLFRELSNIVSLKLSSMSSILSQDKVFFTSRFVSRTRLVRNFNSSSSKVLGRKSEKSLSILSFLSFVCILWVRESWTARVNLINDNRYFCLSSSRSRQCMFSFKATSNSRASSGNL